MASYKRSIFMSKRFLPVLCLALVATAIAWWELCKGPGALHNNLLFAAAGRLHFKR